MSKTRRFPRMLSVVIATGCASYSTESDIRAISQEVENVNGAHREAAVLEALGERGAAQFEVTEEFAAVPSEVDFCGTGLPGHPDPGTITLESQSAAPKSEPATYRIDCKWLRAFARGAASVEAMTSADEAVLSKCRMRVKCLSAAPCSRSSRLRAIDYDRLGKRSLVRREGGYPIDVHSRSLLATIVARIVRRSVPDHPRVLSGAMSCRERVLVIHLAGYTERGASPWLTSL